jgi:hypothetical protein
MRRFFYALALLALFWPQIGNAWTLVAHQAAPSTNGNSATTAAVNITGANLIVVFVGWFSAATTIAISDSASNTWSGPIGTPVSANVALSTYYLFNPTTSASYTVTITSPGNPTFPSVAMMAWSGAATSPLDQAAGHGNVSAGTSVQAGFITPSANNELIPVGLAVDTSLPGSPSINSGFTQLDFVPWVNGVNEAVGSGYLAQTTAAVVNPTWSWTNTSDGAASIQSFLGSSAHSCIRTLRGVGC